MKIWSSTNPSWPVQTGTSGEIVAAFLGIHAYWWNQKGNTLYHQQQSCFHYLVLFLETGEEPDWGGINEDYVLGKFQNEYLDDFKCVGT